MTAEQFIEMIKHDPEMKQEFAYMNRFTDFYDYRAVEFKKRSAEHYLTISLKGVTECSHSKVTIFSIEEFYRDKKNYFHLKKIQFFKQFNKCKNFNLWKKLCK